MHHKHSLVAVAIATALTFAHSTPASAQGSNPAITAEAMAGTVLGHVKEATRGVYLKDAATAGLSAKLEGGILTVNVPKQDEKANVTKVSID